MFLKSDRTHSNSVLSGAVGAGLTLLVVLTAGWRPAQQEQMTVRGLRLVDDAGVLRGSLTTEDDHAGLKLFDASGQERCELLATGEESILTFRNGQNIKRVVLTSGLGDEGLYFQGPEGHDQLGLVATDRDLGLYFPNERGLFVDRTEDTKDLQLVTEK